jgi:hypothetical protein
MAQDRCQLGRDVQFRGMSLWKWFSKLFPQRKLLRNVADMPISMVLLLRQPHPFQKNEESLASAFYGRRWI